MAHPENRAFALYQFLKRVIEDARALPNTGPLPSNRGVAGGSVPPLVWADGQKLDPPGSATTSNDDKE